MRMSELFADAAEPSEPAVTARRSVGRLDDAVRVNTKNYDYYYLCTELRRKRMIPVHTHIRAKSVAEFGELVRHSGEEFIYVLDGAVEVHTEFYDPVVLHEGESIYIDSNMGHAYVAAEGFDEALVLAVCSSADEGLLESLYSLHGDATATHPATAAGSSGTKSAATKSSAMKSSSAKPADTKSAGTKKRPAKRGTRTR
jgi:mannose-6-phosphate isomerase-like protein (cupin superfamily)